jgi:hypothetical protein
LRNAGLKYAKTLLLPSFSSSMIKPQKRTRT